MRLPCELPVLPCLALPCDGCRAASVTGSGKKSPMDGLVVWPQHQRASKTHTWPRRVVGIYEAAHARMQDTSRAGFAFLSSGTMAAEAQGGSAGPGWREGMGSW